MMRAPLFAVLLLVPGLAFAQDEEACDRSQGSFFGAPFTLSYAFPVSRPPSEEPLPVSDGLFPDAGTADEAVAQVCAGGGLVGALDCVTEAIAGAGSTMGAGGGGDAQPADGTDTGSDAASAEGDAPDAEGDTPEPAEADDGMVHLTMTFQPVFNAGDPVTVTLRAAGPTDIRRPESFTDDNAREMAPRVAQQLAILQAWRAQLDATQVADVVRGAAFMPGMPFAAPGILPEGNAPGLTLGAPCASLFRLQSERAALVNMRQASVDRIKWLEDMIKSERAKAGVLGYFWDSEYVDRIERTLERERARLAAIDRDIGEHSAAISLRDRRLNADEREREIAAIRADPQRRAAEDARRREAAIAAAQDQARMRWNLIEGEQAYARRLAAYDALIARAETEGNSDYAEALRSDRGRLETARDSWRQSAEGMLDSRTRERQRLLEENQRDGLGPVEDVTTMLLAEGLNPREVIETGARQRAIELAERRVGTDAATLGGSATEEYTLTDFARDLGESNSEMIDNPELFARRYGAYLGGAAAGTRDAVKDLVVLAAEAGDTAGEAFEIALSDASGYEFNTFGRENTDMLGRGLVMLDETSALDIGAAAGRLADAVDRRIETMAGSGERGVEEALYGAGYATATVLGAEEVALAAALRGGRIAGQIGDAVAGLRATENAADATADAARAANAAADASRAANATTDAARAADAATDASRATDATADVATDLSRASDVARAEDATPTVRLDPESAPPPTPADPAPTPSAVADPAPAPSAVADADAAPTTPIDSEDLTPTVLLDDQPTPSAAPDRPDLNAGELADPAAINTGTRPDADSPTVIEPIEAAPANESRGMANALADADTTPTVRTDPADAAPTVRTDPADATPTVRSDPADATPTVRTDPADATPTVRTDPADAAPTTRTDPADATPTVRADPADPTPTVRTDPADTTPTVRTDPADTTPTVRTDPADAPPTVRTDPADATPTVRTDPADTTPTTRTDPADATPTVHTDPADATPATPTDPADASSAPPSLADDLTPTLRTDEVPPVARSDQPGPAAIDDGTSTTLIEPDAPGPSTAPTERFPEVLPTPDAPAIAPSALPDPADATVRLDNPLEFLDRRRPVPDTPAERMARVNDAIDNSALSPERKAFFRRFAETRSPEEAAARLILDGGVPADSLLREGAMAPDDLRRAIEEYARAFTDMTPREGAILADRTLGGVRKTLEEAGLTEPALTLFENKLPNHGMEAAIAGAGITNNLPPQRLLDAGTLDEAGLRRGLDNYLTAERGITDPTERARLIDEYLAPLHPPPATAIPPAALIPEGAPVVTLAARAEDGTPVTLLREESQLGAGANNTVYRLGPPHEGKVLRVPQHGPDSPNAQIDEFGRQALTDPGVNPERVGVLPRDVVTLPDGTRAEILPFEGRTARNQMEAQPGGAPTSGQSIAMDQAVRELNRNGYAWMDNHPANYFFEPVDEANDIWRVVVLDPGGMVRAADGSPEIARAFQSQVQVIDPINRIAYRGLAGDGRLLDLMQSAREEQLAEFAGKLDLNFGGPRSLADNLIYRTDGMMSLPQAQTLFAVEGDAAVEAAYAALRATN